MNIIAEKRMTTKKPSAILLIDHPFPILVHHPTTTLPPPPPFPTSSFFFNDRLILPSSFRKVGSAAGRIHTMNFSSS